MFEKIAKNYPFIMRLSLFFVFIYFGISEILNPEYFSGYVPELATKFFPIPLLSFVRLHGIVLSFLALSLLFRFCIRYIGVIVIVVLLLIISGLVAKNGFDEIVVRDIGLLGLAFSVWLYEIKAQKKK